MTYLPNPVMYPSPYLTRSLGSKGQSGPVLSANSLFLCFGTSTFPGVSPPPHWILPLIPTGPLRDQSLAPFVSLLGGGIRLHDINYCMASLLSSKSMSSAPALLLCPRPIQSLPTGHLMSAQLIVLPSPNLSDHLHSVHKLVVHSTFSLGQKYILCLQHVIGCQVLSS